MVVHNAFIIFLFFFKNVFPCLNCLQLTCDYTFLVLSESKLQTDSRGPSVISYLEEEV